MKRIATALVVGMMAGVASAQNPPAQAQDSVMVRGQGPGSPEQLRLRVEERWDHRVQTELGLSDQQMDRLRTAQRAHQDRQQALNRREEDQRRTVMQQLQPGVAADNNALSGAIEQIAQIRVERAQSDQQLRRDLGFLSPVQRARYFIMAERFRQMIDAVRVRGMRPGMGPGFRPGPGQMQGPRLQRPQPDQPE